MARQKDKSALKSEPTTRLLSLYSEIMEELRSRNIVRTSNSPAGDYGETLFQKAFGWKLARNSSAGFDAKSKSGKRYEIKCRRETRHNNSRQLGAIRNLQNENFDFLAAVLLNEDYSVGQAIIIPRRSLSKMRARFSKHVNAWLYWLDDDAWKIRGARDVTKKLQAATHRL